MFTSEGESTGASCDAWSLALYAELAIVRVSGTMSVRANFESIFDGWMSAKAILKYF